MKNNKSTSWERSAGWYKKIVGEKGHYYHQKVVMPGVLRMMDIKAGEKILDLACGEGLLSRQLPDNVEYTGVDIAPSLINKARSGAPKGAKFIQADITKELNLATKDFDKVTIILALQNLRSPKKAITNAAKALKKNGDLIIVLNHPVFRIPRFSSWGIDQSRKLQYRRIDRYLTPIEIPITMHPGEKNSDETWTFHNPLSEISKMLYENGFLMELIEEWVSDKKSFGGAAKMENRARNEIPMFMAIKAIKK